MKSNPQLVEKLIQAENYREFIRITLGDSKKLNLADLARKMGFSSRAYISDLMSGKKRMTANAFPRCISALKLNGLLAQLFQLLVLKEEEHLPREKGLTKERIEERLKETRQRLKEKYLTPSNSSDLNFLSYEVFSVYAALGSHKQGASLSDILKRTQIHETTVSSILNSMMEAQCIVKKQDRYFASRINFDIKNLGTNLGFKQAFIQATQHLGKKAQQMEQHPTDLFFHCAFAVNKDKIPEMRERLQELIYEYLDNQTNEDGDTVKKITLGFY